MCGGEPGSQVREPQERPQKQRPRPEDFPGDTPSRQAIRNWTHGMAVLLWSGPWPQCQIGSALPPCHGEIPHLRCPSSLLQLSPRALAA